MDKVVLIAFTFVLSSFLISTNFVNSLFAQQTQQNQTNMTTATNQTGAMMTNQTNQTEGVEETRLKKAP
jgi:hypothetical protein